MVPWPNSGKQMLKYNFALSANPDDSQMIAYFFRISSVAQHPPCVVQWSLIRYYGAAISHGGTKIPLFHSSRSTLAIFRVVIISQDSINVHRIWSLVHVAMAKHIELHNLAHCRWVAMVCTKAPTKCWNVRHVIFRSLCTHSYRSWEEITMIPLVD